MAPRMPCSTPRVTLGDVTAYPAWTPAARPGIIPLHPLGFGTILGRSFTALRQNPKVLLGFALCTQVVGYLITIVAVGGVALWSFSRLDTLRPGTDDWDAVLAGSIALTVAAGVVLGLAVTALSVVVQGIVVAEVSREVVAEKQTLGQLWARVRPVFWRLLGYTLLLTLAVAIAVGLAALALIAIGSTGPGGIVGAVVLGILFLLGAIPLGLWLTTKLSLVTPTIVLERATIRGAIARSWVLIRGRFWVALGVIVIISVSISVLAQVVSIPFSLASTLISTVVTPTGEPTATAIVSLIVATLLTEAVILLVQAIGIVVQATATTLIYVDCRMRHEGLDLDLLAYVERRDAGAQDLPDPYTPHPERPHPARPAYPAYRAYPGPTQSPGAYAPPTGYAPQPPYGTPPAQGAPPPPPYGAPPPYGTPAPPPAAEPPAPTQWTAPGAPPEEGREHP